MEGLLSTGPTMSSLNSESSNLIIGATLFLVIWSDWVALIGSAKVISFGLHTYGQSEPCLGPSIVQRRVSYLV